MKIELLLSAATCALITAAASPVLAAEADSAAVSTAPEVEAVVVYGQGSSRQVQVINAKDLLQATPGSSPIKLVSKLPGVNFTSSDAYGAYEWSTRISIRGFNQNQLGFTLDGVPLGDMSYANHNGLHISRAIASEDLGKVELAQGSGSLNTASSSNLGGTLKFFSRDPSQTFGGALAGTFGSDSTFRGYGRIDTGVLATGGRAYLSYVNQKSDKWKGYGEQKQQQIDFKFVQPIGKATITGFVNHSERREDDYQDLSLEMIKRLGYRWDNFGRNSDYAKANTIADTALAGYIANGFQVSGDPAYCVSDPGNGINSYPAPVKCGDDAYFDASGLRNDTLWSLNGKAPITAALDVTGTVYGHTNKGQGTWWAPLNPSPNFGVAGATTSNSSMSERITEYNIDRKGLILGAGWAIGAHTIEAGVWYENNDYENARRYYALDRAANNRDPLKFQTGAFKTKWDYNFNTKTTQFSLADTWKVTDSFKINAGFKSLKIENTATLIGGYAPLVNSGKIEAKDKFLPQVGFLWNVVDNGEMFGGYAENMRAFVSSATVGPFATTQAGFNFVASTLKPETSKTVELGYRFHTDNFQGVIAVYDVKFDNRLIGSVTGSGVAGNPVVLANAGSVTTKGIEAAGTWTFIQDWSLFGSYAYNNSTFDANTVTPAATFATKGKTLPTCPRACSRRNWLLTIAHTTQRLASTTRTSATSLTPTTRKCRPIPWSTFRLATASRAKAGPRASRCKPMPQICSTRPMSQRSVRRAMAIAATAVRF